jgi:glycosyltransferase involved in cell wall biosynthesis
MKISVLMCNYNYGAFIAQAIESVLGQTFADFELLIVDDGSTDSSRDVIAAYDDPRIIKVFQENGGQASAFNAGFEKSSGEVVCFLDSDDWWEEGKLATVVRWHDLLRADYAVLQHQLMVWDNGDASPYKAVLPSGDCFSEMCKTGNIDYFVPTSGISLPRKVCDKVFPIPEMLKICADAFLTRASIAFGKVVSIPEIQGYYRKHQNTVYMNPEFAHRDFFQNRLFPALKTFYSDNGIVTPAVMSVKTEKTQLSLLKGLIKKVSGIGALPIFFG